MDLYLINTAVSLMNTVSEGQRQKRNGGYVTKPLRNEVRVARCTKRLTGPISYHQHSFLVLFNLDHNMSCCYLVD